MHLPFQQLWLHDRYGPGQRFGKHVDDSVDLGEGIVTEYTLLIYLTGSGSVVVSKPKGCRPLNQRKDSSDLTGGETTFYGMLHIDFSSSTILLPQLILQV